jgi:hypothetical protein
MVRVVVVIRVEVGVEPWTFKCRFFRCRVYLEWDSLLMNRIRSIGYRINGHEKLCVDGDAFPVRLYR